MTGGWFSPGGGFDWFRTLIGSVASFVENARAEPDSEAAVSLVPDGDEVYAVGDVHGSLTLLDDLLARIGDDAKTAPGVGRRTLIFLGDYIDRGPDSAGVIERLAGLSMPGFTIHHLVGNHELAMLDFLRDPEGGQDWLRFGGIATLASYGVPGLRDTDDPAELTALRDRLRERMPPHHQTFLENLQPMVTVGDYGFVHAGVRPGVSLARQNLDDLCWIRDPFLTFPGRHEKRIVHGHSITPYPEVRDNRIGIDTGAYAGGPLTAIALRGSTIRFIQARPPASLAKAS